MYGRLFRVDLSSDLMKLKSSDALNTKLPFNIGIYRLPIAESYFEAAFGLSTIPGHC